MESFYTQAFMILVAVLGIIVSVTYRGKFAALKFMPVYFSASVVQTLCIYYSTVSDEGKKLERVFASLFILIEFLVLYSFFHKVIVMKNLRQIQTFIFLFFGLYVVFACIFTNALFLNPDKLYLPQSVAILVFCLLYFLQIFSLPPKYVLPSDPAFWVATGCLFYFACTIPLFFVEVFDLIPYYHSIYSINYLSYSVFFVLITKAFLCNPVPLK